MPALQTARERLTNKTRSQQYSTDIFTHHPHPHNVDDLQYQLTENNNIITIINNKQLINVDNLQYRLTDSSVSWAEHRPVYKHLAKDRL